MSSAPITYSSRYDVTQEAEISALASVYKLVLAKEAAPESRPDDAERNRSDSASINSTA